MEPQHLLPLYEHSGRTGARALFLPLAGAMLAGILGAIYAAVDVYLPIGGYITFLLVAGFGVGLGFGIGWLGKALKCRNTLYITINGLLLSLFGLYTSWVVFEALLLNRFTENFSVLNALPLFFTPQAVFNIAGGIAEDGWFTIFHMTPSGGFLWTLWGIEGVSVIGMGTLLCTSQLKESVFCEFANGWCTKWSPIRLALPTEASVLDDIQSGDMIALAKLPTVDGMDYPRLNVIVHEAPNGGRTHAYEVKVLTRSIDSDGKPKETTADFAPKRLISAQDLECLRLLAKREPVPPAPESAEAA